MLVFFDSSAFAKRYVSEVGTDSVMKWCGRATEVGLSVIALPEIISAFCRLMREFTLDKAQYRSIKTLLLADIEDVAICDVTPAVLAQTTYCLEHNILRGMDAIHVGSAAVMKADVFITADRRQRDAAVRVGLRAEMV